MNFINDFFSSDMMWPMLSFIAFMVVMFFIDRFRFRNKRKEDRHAQQ